MAEDEDPDSHSWGGMRGERCLRKYPSSPARLIPSFGVDAVQRLDSALVCVSLCVYSFKNNAMEIGPEMNW